MTFLFSGPNGDRTKRAFMAGLVGLLVNLMLGVFKILAGWQSGFLSVMGDGFNNITDMGSVVLLMMTFYYAAKPSDKEHPFGHGRLEYINSTVMAAVILYVGITLLVESVQKIIHPRNTEFTVFVAIILVIGLLAKLFLAWWYKRAGEKIGSKAFEDLQRRLFIRHSFHQRCIGGHTGGIFLRHPDRWYYGLSHVPFHSVDGIQYYEKCGELHPWRYSRQGSLQEN